MDFSNWAQEREKLMNEIFIKLREKEDKLANITITGKIEINANKIQEIEKEYLLGPYYFSQSFSTTPNLQITPARQSRTAPLWMVCDVASWVLDSGAVDGFYVGLYPLSMPLSGTVKHTLLWSAHGKASRLPRGHIRQSWSARYSDDQEFRMGA